MVPDPREEERGLRDLIMVERLCFWVMKLIVVVVLKLGEDGDDDNDDEEEGDVVGGCLEVEMV